MRLHILGLLAVTGLAGCASYADIRAQAPIYSTMVAGQPEGLAACTLDSLALRNGPSGYSKLGSGDEVHIAYAFVGSTQAVPLSDIAFMRSGGGQTRIEVRSANTTFGKDQGATDVLHEIVAKCSSAQAA